MRHNPDLIIMPSGFVTPRVPKKPFFLTDWVFEVFSTRSDSRSKSTVRVPKGRLVFLPNWQNHMPGAITDPTH